MKRKIIKTHELDGNYILEVQFANKINNLKQILMLKCNLLNTMIEKDNQC